MGLRNVSMSKPPRGIGAPVLGSRRRVFKRHSNGAVTDMPQLL